jgi:hypothetical protein
MEVFKADQLPLPADEAVERAARAGNPDLLAAPPPQQAGIVIAQPADGALVPRGLLSIRGTVNPPGFQSYQVEYGAGDAPERWEWISGPHLSPVVDEQLTQWGMEGLPAGRYTLRVTAFTDGGTQIGISRFDVAP